MSEVSVISGGPTFDREHCPKCGNPAKLLRNSVGMYHWNCCSRSWVTCGSVMDVMNELIFTSLEKANG